jgi:hypothetical protein
LTYYRSLLPIQRKTTGPLALGARVHNALERKYKDGDDLLAAYVDLLEGDKLLAIEVGDDIEKFEKEGELGRIMLEGYEPWIEENGLDANLEILGAEEILRMPMFNGEVELIGKLDLRVKRKWEETTAALDFKTTANMDDFLVIANMDEQLMTYILLDYQQDDATHVDGAIFRLMRKVRRTPAASPPFYHQHEVRHNSFTMRSFWNRIHGVVNEIMKVRKGLDAGATHTYVAYPTPKRDCKFDCFSGETQYLTRNGVKTLAETVGTTQYVLDSTARWVPAEIREFGEQELFAVNLRRGRITKTVYATAGHRWFTDIDATDPIGRRRRSSQELVTSSLKPGDVLSTTTPPCYTGRYRVSPVGVMHGFTVGDGTVRGKGSIAYLHGLKDKELLQYFGMQYIDASEREEALVVKDLPKYFKTTWPALDENCSYLYGWLSGLFAADGSVSSSGQIKLHSSDLRLLEHVRDISHVLGIQVWDIKSGASATGRYKDNDLYSIGFNARTLTKDFFLLSHHRERWESGVSKKQYSIKWKVVKVEPTSRVETVYCAVVPSTQSFTLDGYILTGNCVFFSICPMFDDGSAVEHAIEDMYVEGNPYERYGDALSHTS